ncbi:MAG: DoxX family membrane protein [Flavobacteriales bacterium]|nr:DoxX family membrane protein [Flavobacteriales bacterium]
MENIKNIIYVVLRLFLGVMILLAGVNKFIKPIASPAEFIETVQKVESVDEHHLQKKLFVGAMQQTEYFWEFLAVAEIIFGLLILMQVTGLLGAIMMVPITLNILLLHIFLEPDEVGELVYVAVLFAINVALIWKEKEKVLPLLKIKAM